jgi:hypothetical protein
LKSNVPYHKVVFLTSRNDLNAFFYHNVVIAKKSFISFYSCPGIVLDMEQLATCLKKARKVKGFALHAVQQERGFQTHKFADPGPYDYPD